MDIQGWLAATEDRAAPDEVDDRAAQDDVRYDGFPDRIGRLYHRKRKRASSDSSLIAPKPLHRHGDRTLPSTSSKLEYGRSRSSTSSSVSSRPPRKEQEPQYGRRPRRKTRPDRYERKAKAPRKERDRKHEKPKRRRSHRTHDGSRTTGLVQGFQLKNGPKNSRLTLKPDLNAGLFKHGRASAQVAGRGTGLPDLAFNEMRFLQKPDEHQDKPHDPEEPRRSKKEERKRTQDEEISAYFTTQKQAPGKPHVPGREHAHEHKSDGVATTTLRRATSRQPEAVVGLSDKPFLGFGSKGGQPDIRQSTHDSDSYYTWSVSQPRNKSTEQQRPSGPRYAEPGAHRMSALHSSDRWRHRSLRNDSLAQDQEVADGVKATHKATQQRVGGGRHPIARKSQRPSVEVSGAPAVLDRNGQAVYTSPTHSNAQSLPREASNYIASLREDERDLHRDDEQLHQFRYHTSDILNLQDHGMALEPVAVLASRTYAEEGKENQEPGSSLLIDDMLSRVREQLSKHAYTSKHVPSQPHDIVHNESTAESYAGIPIERAYSRPGSEHSPPRTLQTLRTQARPSSPRTAEIGRRATLPQQGVRPLMHSSRPSKRLATPFQHDPVQRMMARPRPLPLLQHSPCDHATEARVRDLAHGPICIPLSGVFEAQDDPIPRPSGPLCSSAPSQTLKEDWVPQQSIGEHHLAVISPLKRYTNAGDVGMADFWKPNRLY